MFGTELGIAPSQDLYLSKSRSPFCSCTTSRLRTTQYFVQYSDFKFFKKTEKLVYENLNELGEEINWWSIEPLNIAFQ
jgi:hypothetical protein